MDEKQIIRVSKFLSFHLRHHPERLGLELQEGGWVSVEDLLAACGRQGVPLSHGELGEVVRQNDKKRFAFDETGLLIRANQGHSVDVDLQLEPREPPTLLLHGTAQHFLSMIFEQGLQKMDRHHVHLTTLPETALKTGQRKGKPVILEVDAAGLHAAGTLFYLTANAVWLVDEVPPAYLHVLEQ